MQLDRRAFLQLAAGGALACSAAMTPADGKSASAFKAVVFDAFPIFDPRPVAARVEALFPGRGAVIMNAWRTRQFEYQWLRALSGRYADFLQTTEEALEFADKQLKLGLSTDQRQQLMSEWSNLKVWPDAAGAINALHEAGIRLAVLSNMTTSVLANGLKAARLDSMFEHILSTDQMRSFKPDPRTYQLAAERLQLRPDEILFVPFAGWDVAGAKWFGYPTFWVNRLDAPAEELGVEADAAAADLGTLVGFVLGKTAK
jgi:2-haloacid dehalogenase